MQQRQERMRVPLIWGGILLAAGLVLLLAASVAGFSGMGPGMMPGPGGMMGPVGGGFVVNPFWGVITFLSWILVLGGLVLLGIWLVRTLWPGITAPPAGAPDEPLRIAQLRYARGEISHEEYERIRQDLTRAA